MNMQVNTLFLNRGHFWIARTYIVSICRKYYDGIFFSAVIGFLTKGHCCPLINLTIAFPVAAYVSGRVHKPGLFRF